MSKNLNSLPDFFNFESFNLYHSDFIGLPVWVYPVFIFIVVEIMENFNSRYRHQKVLKLKKYVVPLYVVSLLSIFYYAFLEPSCFLSQAYDGSDKYRFIAWFCYPKNVGWGWTIFCTIAIIHVVYCMISVLLQILHDWTGKDDVRIGHFWQSGRTFWLVCTLFWVIPYYLQLPGLSDALVYSLFVVMILYLVLPCIVLPRYGVKLPVAILQSLVFTVSMLIIMSIGVESVRVTYALVLPIFILFGRARSYSTKKFADKADEVSVDESK